MVPNALPAMPVVTTSESALVTQETETTGQSGELYVNIQPSSQVLEAGQTAAVQLPSGVFKNSDSSARTSVEATLVDGQPLPNWLTFNKSSGQFTGTPPAGTTGNFDIKLTAKDDRGNSASTEFILRIADSKVGGQDPASSNTPSTSVTTTTTGGSTGSETSSNETRPTTVNQPSSPSTVSSQPLNNAPLSSTTSSSPLVLRGSTDGLNDGLQLVIAPAEQSAITNRESVFQLPAGTFKHSDSSAKVNIEAKMADGQALPTWLSFDAENGKFSGTPPANSTGVITLRIVATDDAGNAVSTEFRIRIDPLTEAEQEEVPGEAVEQDALETETAEQAAKRAKANQLDPAAQQASLLPRGRASLSEQIARHGRQGLARDHGELQKHLQRLAEQRAVKNTA